MCGISALISFNSSPVRIIEKMSTIIRHRGPDDEGYIVFQELDDEPIICGGNDTPDGAYTSSSAYTPTQQLEHCADLLIKFALAHRRLSIVDPSPLGHQPMCSVDGRYWIVFNGEVYNHIELRKELEQLKHQFVSHSDTEVILAAYHEWGKECLSHFNGMFAFLIFDRINFTLFAARDRFGVKPLYYRVSKDYVAFASEIKQFTVLPDWQAVLNGQRAYDFLNWGLTDHTDETLFLGVFQLCPGQLLELNLRDLEDKRDQLSNNKRLPVSSSMN